MTAVPISIADLIELGTFGPIAIGSTRHAVGAIFGEPTDATITNRRQTSCVWRYGEVEFHFDDDLLSLIHCDADDLFEGGPTLAIHPWKLRLRMPLLEVKAILDAKAIYYTGCDDCHEPDCLLKLNSGCTLGFVLDSDAGFGPTGLRSWSIIRGG
ncbi:MAG: hypothetical protein Aurels2KO_57950 [Aureliella sp.]